MLGKSSGRATEHVLRFCCRAKPSITFKKPILKKIPRKLVRVCTSIFIFPQKPKIYSAPAQENQIQTPGTILFSTIFKLQRRGPSGSRARKLLRLCHRHGSPPRSKEPISTLPNIRQRKSFWVLSGLLVWFRLYNVLQARV